jgi:molybdate transport repressor ModE-like protein
VEDLRLLQAIGKAGTLTEAARSLGVDHSTAFRRLGALERRCGARLFERARDGYAPTPAGEAALAAAAEILEQLCDLERRLAGQDLRPAGTVRMTTTETLLDLMGPVIAALRAEHPEILVELVVTNAFFTLTKRDADVALRPAAAAPESLVGRRLAALATAPYASPSYLARSTARVELSSHDWIGFEDSLSHLAAARWLAAHVAPDRIVGRANSLLALRAMARAGMGVAALPCYLGDADPSLRRAHPPLVEMAASLWLLTHPDLRRVMRIRTVLDFVAGRLSERRALIEGGSGPAPSEPT